MPLGNTHNTHTRTPHSTFSLHNKKITAYSFQAVVEKNGIFEIELVLKIQKIKTTNVVKCRVDKTKKKK
jgi:hypothetical protein